MQRDACCLQRLCCLWGRPRGLEEPLRTPNMEVANIEVKTQKALLEQLRTDRSLQAHLFVKAAPVVMYPLTLESLESLPQSISGRLGTVDAATYAPDMLKTCLGGAVLLQVADGGKPDFYPINSVDHGRYKEVPLDDVAARNPALYAGLGALLGKEGSSLAEVPGLIGALKVAPVAMYRFSDLGFPVAQEATIEAPWKGTQTKPAGKDAFLALGGSTKPEETKECYMINIDENGLPIAYMPAED